MSVDAIKKLCAALGRHSEVISEAYLHQRNTISVNDDTDAAVKSLLNLRLAWFLDEEEGVRLSSKLIHLLDQAVRSDRQLHTSNNAAMYWRDLNGCLADYKKSVSPSDIDMNRTALQECAAKLIEEIRFAISQFGRFIERGYAYTQSADIRLQQNERTLAKAQELVEMMESFDLLDYQRATGTDSDLRTLFYRHLPNAFEAALKDLRHVLGGLQNLITKIREEQALASLLRTFENAFERNPGYLPSEPAMMNGVVEVLNCADPILQPAAPNLYDYTQADALVVLVQSLGVSKSIATPDVVATNVDILNVTDQSEPAPTPDILYQAAEACLAWLDDEGGERSASDFYAALAITEPYDLWLYALLNFVQGMPDTDQKRLSIDYHEIQHPVLDGNRTITDFTLGMAHV